MTQTVLLEHFIADLPVETARDVFKMSVFNVELSISSYCNRRCHYCPNHIVDRISKKDYMSDGLFINIMETLRSIDYSGAISIHRYNEPLADKAYALSRISSIRSFIPKASLRIYTNGDYLTKQYLQSLADLGIEQIYATIHGRKDGDSFETLYDELRTRIARLGLPHTIYPTAGLVVCDNLKMAYNILPDVLSDRGESIAVGEQHERVEPCFSPFNELQVEYDGTLLPCCNLHPDVDAHKIATLGKIDETSDIIQVWAGQTYVAWRKSLFSFERKASPCANCNYGIRINNTPEHVAMVNNFRDAFGL